MLSRYDQTWLNSPRSKHLFSWYFFCKVLAKYHYFLLLLLSFFSFNKKKLIPCLARLTCFDLFLFFQCWLGQVKDKVACILFLSKLIFHFFFFKKEFIIFLEFNNFTI